MSFETLRSRLTEHGPRPAIVSDGQCHSHAELAAEVDRREQACRAAGIGAGDVVVLLGDFSFAALAELLALLLCRATVVPLTPQAHAKLADQVAALQPDVLVDSRQPAPERLRQSRDGSAAWRSVLPVDAGGLVVFTSGSTGQPKAIVHDIDSLCYRYLARKPPVSAICFLLFDHMGGINTVLHLLFQGGLAVNPGTRQVDVVCEAIARHQVQLLPATPSFLSQLLLSRAHERHDLSSLKVISYGTEVMSETVLQKLNAVLPGCVFKQTYGLSETGVLQIKSRSNDSLWFRFIDPGVRWKVENDVLWISTRSNLRGKLLFSPEGPVLETSDSEWFCTQDLVARDGDELMVLGRQTDIVNVGGLKVYPSEVENCIQALPFVDEVLVKGKKNPLLGQIVVAHVQLHDGQARPEAERLIRQHCASRLERYKVPSQFIFGTQSFVNDRFKKVRTP
ncbi:class I adenylate-forming enzyme family protein [Pseudaquabacterium pictum]|uniref:AMP-dependent synthetase n=1 Tax=Pseudaquabacterium pictum TaxID=2315236 RepID=A0A480B4C3_9BURK|nr:long-chain fatty acid--CoA ligase [Rubrivivax pictus]GCL65938.1 AMP-dependent synthetase [Rubrivivax pictus]